MSWIECRNDGCSRPRLATVVSTDDANVPPCRSCGDAAYVEHFDIDYSNRWDDVFGYITKEFSIDDNDYRVVFHLEHNGYFTGYYADVTVLEEGSASFYRAMLDQMVKDLENRDD